MTSAMLFQIQSMLIFTLLSVGIITRRNRKVHAPIMLSVILWDIFLVLQIELNRGAIAKASKALSNPFLLNFHVAISTLCILMYLFLFFSGRKMLKNDLALKNKHKLIGFTAYALRGLTLLTSYFVVIPKN